MAITVPAQFKAPFAYAADAGTINEPIPDVNNNPGSPQNASFSKGFPAITMPNDPSTGRPPNGQDMNGILNEMTQLSVWQCVGGGFQYNGTLYNNSNPYMTGYPIGARVKRSDGNGYWLSVVDNNQTDPDSSGNVGWVPDSPYGIYQITITNISTTQVILTKTQAAFNTIIINGLTPTNELTIIVPSSLLKQYYFVNLLPVNITIKTDNLNSNSIILYQNSVNVLTILDVNIIKDLNSTYATHPDINSLNTAESLWKNYFMTEGTGTPQLLGNDFSTLNMSWDNIGKNWFNSFNQIILPFSGIFHFYYNLTFDVTSAANGYLVYRVKIVQPSIGLPQYYAKGTLPYFSNATIACNSNFLTALEANTTIEIQAVNSSGTSVITNCVVDQVDCAAITS